MRHFIIRDLEGKSDELSNRDRLDLILLTLGYSIKSPTTGELEMAQQILDKFKLPYYINNTDAKIN